MSTPGFMPVRSTQEAARTGHRQEVGRGSAGPSSPVPLSGLASSKSHGQIVRRSRRGKLPRATGAQLSVQMKMIEITNLLRASPATATDDAYAEDARINGLCGGWTYMFMQHPDWVEPVYNAARTWTRPDDSSDSEALADFERHLAATTAFEGAEHVASLLRRVYIEMDRLEPDAGYDQDPQWIDDLDVGDLPGTPTQQPNARTTDTVIKFRKGGAAQTVCDELQRLTQAEAQGECMAHIESDAHHMAVRVQRIPRDSSGRHTRLVITVVETEKRGIVKVTTWPEVQRILHSWLAEEKGLTEVALAPHQDGGDAVVGCPRTQMACCDPGTSRSTSPGAVLRGSVPPTSSPTRRCSRPVRKVAGIFATCRCRRSPGRS